MPHPPPRPPRSHSSRWSQQDVIDEYRRLTQSLRRFPSNCEFERDARMSVGTARKHFPTLAHLRDAIKGPPEDRWEHRWLAQVWSRVRVACANRSSVVRDALQPYDLVFALVHDWPDCPRKVLAYQASTAVIRAHRRHSPSDLPRRTQRRLRRASRAEIIAALQRLHSSQPRFTFVDFQKFAAITSWNIYLEFETWEQALRAAGIPLPPRSHRRRISDAALLDDWVQLKRQLGRAPNSTELTAGTTHCRSMYRERFGPIASVTRRGESHELFLAAKALDPDWKPGLSEFAPRLPPDCQSPSELWSKQTVGFELTSRGTADWTDHPHVLLCVQHDWPAYPHWVVELRDLPPPVSPRFFDANRPQRLISK